MLAKLAAGMNKPNGQTILRLHVWQGSFPLPPSGKCLLSYQKTILKQCLLLLCSRHLGGKLGSEIAQNLNIINIGQLCDITMQTLQSMFGIKTGYIDKPGLHFHYFNTIDLGCMNCAEGKMEKL